MKTLGQVAYEAYSEEIRGKYWIFDEDLPPWDDHHEDVKQAWQKAAEAAVESFIEVKNA